MSILDYREECIAAFNEVDFAAVASVAEALQMARHANQSVFVAGNGGSAAAVSHMATDLLMGTQLVNPPLRVMALTDNQAIIIATGNDFDFAQNFERQLSLLARPGDLLIAVSASGNSPNKLNCVEEAKAMKLTTIGFTGSDGGKLATMVDLLVHVPPTRTGAYGPVEGVHLSLNQRIIECFKRYSANEKQTI